MELAGLESVTSWVRSRLVLGGCTNWLLDIHAPIERQLSIGVLDDNRVVRGAQHGCPRLASEFKEQSNQFNCIRPIETCRRLVGEEQRRSGRKGPCDCHASLLAGGQTRDSLCHPITKPDSYQYISGAPALPVIATNRKGRIHVLIGAQKRDKHGLLCDQRNVLPTELGPRLSFQLAQRYVPNTDLARGGKIETCQEVKERRLSRARGSCNRVKYTGFEACVETFENRCRARSPPFRNPPEDGDGSER